jgi:pimeloyl-ACP methyl ester carboxylesterase
MPESVMATTLRISDAAIADLRERLARTRFPDQAPGPAWSYGADLEYTRQLVQYWRNGFDWRAQEARLNAFPQYTTELFDIGLHFLHVPGRGPAPTPLLLLHGWPGSVFEFLDVIPRLTDPARFGGDPADAFTVVAPSLPGYGLSFKPGQRRFGIEEIADCVAELMVARLGYPQFAVQGGDWGAITAARLGYAHPQKLIGIHVNLLAVRRERDNTAAATPEEERYSTKSPCGSGKRPDTRQYRGPSRRRSLSGSPIRRPAWRRGLSRNSAAGRIVAAMSRARSRATSCSPMSAFIGSPVLLAPHFSRITTACAGRGRSRKAARSTCRPAMRNFRARSCGHPARSRREPTATCAAGPRCRRAVILPRWNNPKRWPETCKISSVRCAPEIAIA